MKNLFVENFKEEEKVIIYNAMNKHRVIKGSFNRREIPFKKNKWKNNKEKDVIYNVFSSPEGKIVIDPSDKQKAYVDFRIKNINDLPFLLGEDLYQKIDFENKRHLKDVKKRFLKNQYSITDISKAIEVLKDKNLLVLIDKVNKLNQGLHSNIKGEDFNFNKNELDLIDSSIIALKFKNYCSVYFEDGIIKTFGIYFPDSEFSNSGRINSERFSLLELVVKLKKIDDSFETKLRKIIC